MVTEKKGLLEEIYSDGAVTLALANVGPRLYCSWILSQLGALVLTIEKLRLAGGAADTEYGLEVSLETRGNVELRLVDDAWMYVGANYVFEQGSFSLPRFSLGDSGERVRLINEVMQEILHAAGCGYEMEDRD